MIWLIMLFLPLWRLRKGESNMAKVVLEPGEQEVLFGAKLFLSATRKMGISDENAVNMLSEVLKEQRENPNYDWCKSKIINERD